MSANRASGDGDLNPDVVIVGAGGDGPALAWRLGQQGIDVLVCEAGPWHGNEKWPEPHEKPGATESGDPEDLSGSLLDEQFTGLEGSTADPLTGKLRVGPADRDRGPWLRAGVQSQFVKQINAVGGTTLQFFANFPRAYPTAINDQPDWPIDYAELVEYYKLSEAKSDVHPAPTTAKERLFYDGANAAGFDLIDQLNVTDAGYRPQPNAITPPDEKLRDEEYDGPFTYPEVEGHTLVADAGLGSPTPLDAPVSEKARKSSNVSWVPRALETGNVTIRPNTFVTEVTTSGGPGDPAATGVRYRDTWSGERGRIEADVVVLAAGCIETPRLFLNSDLPANDWVGKGLTTHWFDFVVGVFDERTLQAEIGDDAIEPYVGHNAGARVDKPGVGGLEAVGFPPGTQAMLCFQFSQQGLAADNDTAGEPWDSTGVLAGEQLKRVMADYRRTLPILVLTDDRPRQSNGVSVSPISDEHGPVPTISWEGHPDDAARRDELARDAARLLDEAGAYHVHRTDWPPLLLHMQSSMAMGRVVDEGCEAYDVDRLFVGDHSALANGLGGANPTNTGQALAIRTADEIADRYF